MFAIAFLFVRVRCDCFKSRQRLEAEILVLRYQLNVLQQRAHHRLCLSWIDRALFVWLYRGYPRILDAITILRPETIVRWHCKGFSVGRTLAGEFLGLVVPLFAGCSTAGSCNTIEGFFTFM